MPTSNININHRGTLALLRGLVPHRTVNQREALQVAELQAARLRQHLGIDDARFPAEALDLPRIRIEYDANLPSSGMTLWNGASWIIFLNSAEASNRQRFSMLHEFKHIIDHTTKVLLYGKDTKRSGPAAEQAADYFAACALMPKLYVKRHWGEGPRDIATMARTFRVSPASMRYRLDQLGLLDRQRRCGSPRSAYLRQSRTLEIAA